jgi:hypothetical protein
MRTSPLLAVAIAVLAPSFAACGAVDGGHDADDGVVNCAVETTADEFVVGLEKAGATGRLNFQLMSATPAPPARGDNEWVLQVSALTNGVVGAPVSGATMFVTPFMPKHQHGTPIDVVIEAMPAAGQYKLSPVNLWMPGLWETEIEVTASSSGTDSAVYRFCIPG